MATLPQIFQQTFQTSLANGEIIASLVIFAVVAIVGWSAYIVISRYMCRWTQKTATTLDDDILAAVKVIIIIMIVILGIEYALSPLSFLKPYGDTLSGVFLVIQIMMSAFAAVTSCFRSNPKSCATANARMPSTTPRPP